MPSSSALLGEDMIGRYEDQHLVNGPTDGNAEDQELKHAHEDTNKRVIHTLVNIQLTMESPIPGRSLARNPNFRNCPVTAKLYSSERVKR